MRYSFVLAELEFHCFEAIDFRLRIWGYGRFRVLPIALVALKRVRLKLIPPSPLSLKVNVLYRCFLCLVHPNIDFFFLSNCNEPHFENFLFFFSPFIFFGCFILLFHVLLFVPLRLTLYTYTYVVFVSSLSNLSGYVGQSRG